jgi:hypothetical protein
MPTINGMVLHLEWCIGMILEDTFFEDGLVVHVLVESLQVCCFAYPDVVNEVPQGIGIVFDEGFEFGVVEVDGFVVVTVPVFVFCCEGEVSAVST